PPASVDRWALARSISEDGAVAVFERTVVASDHRLARAIVTLWGEYKARGCPEMESMLRRVMKRQRVLTVTMETMAMDDASLVDMVTNSFEVERMAPADRESEAARELVSDDLVPNR